MANLDSLLSKIKEDGDKEVKDILDEAKSQEKAIIEKKRGEALEEADRIIARTKDQAEIAAERIISNTKIKIRDEKLAAKQKLIDKTFDLALEKLEAMSKDEFLNYLENSLLKTDINGDETILLSNKRFKEVGESINKINTALKESGRLGDLKLEAADIEDGFIIQKTGVEINFTFRRILDNYREELELEVSKMLFK